MIIVTWKNGQKWLGKVENKAKNSLFDSILNRFLDTAGDFLDFIHSTVLNGTDDENAGNL